MKEMKEKIIDMFSYINMIDDPESRKSFVFDLQSLINYLDESERKNNNELNEKPKTNPRQSKSYNSNIGLQPFVINLNDYDRFYDKNNFFKSYEFDVNKNLNDLNKSTSTQQQLHDKALRREMEQKEFIAAILNLINK